MSGQTVCAEESRTVAAKSPPESAQLQTEVKKLSSKSFEERQAAEESLLKLGESVFPQLIEALQQAPPEQTLAILSLLERLWLSSPVERADSLEQQLHELAWQVGPHQAEVAAILDRHAALREARAIKSLRRLYVVVKMQDDPSKTDLLYQTTGEFPQNRPQIIRQIAIPRSWKGSDRDLWHFQRLTHSPEAVIYYAQGTLSKSQQLSITSHRTQERSEVFLGITYDAWGGGDGCLISSVEPEGSAAMAGIQPGDLVTGIDDEPIDSFQDLVECLKTKRSYQEFQVTLRRDGVKLVIPVIGQPWEASRFETPPPPPEAMQLLEGFPPYRGVPNYLPPPEIAP